jgi:hypothetical protein
LKLTTEFVIAAVKTPFYDHPDLQSAVPQTTPQPPRRWRAIVWGNLIVIAIVGVTVYAVMAYQSRKVVPANQWGSYLDENEKIRPLTEVIELTRQLKLITVKINARVPATVTDRRRVIGEASASIEVPVTYQYGVDLSNLPEHALSFQHLSQHYVLTVPQPTMLSCEVDNSKATKEQLEVSTWRFKRLNQDLLIAAHKKAEKEARRQMLSPEKLEEIRRLTREQLERLVKAFLVDDKPLEVRFEETPESTALGAQ